MHIVHVHVQVQPGKAAEFLAATEENARQTRQEPGALAFDILQERDAPEHFVLVEIYRDEAGMAAHKDTAHYAQWRDTVQPWMAQPRRGVKLVQLSPAPGKTGGK